MSPQQKIIFRIIDANLNRCREGLRVIEDISRFCFDNAAVSQSLKRIRHQLVGAVKHNKKIVLSREVLKDVGRQYQVLEGKRKSLFDLIIANFRRVEESLRVLEEVAKVVMPVKAKIFKKLRFQTYRIEKKFYAEYDKF